MFILQEPKIARTPATIPAPTSAAATAAPAPTSASVPAPTPATADRARRRANELFERALNDSAFAERMSQCFHRLEKGVRDAFFARMKVSCYVFKDIMCSVYV